MNKSFSRTLAASAAILALVMGVAPAAWADDEEKSVTSVFKVEGMTCGGCEAGISIAVNKLEGVEKVVASTEEGRATVTYDPEKVTAEKIEAAIEKLGYDAELQKQGEKA